MHAIVKKMKYQCLLCAWINVNGFAKEIITLWGSRIFEVNALTALCHYASVFGNKTNELHYSIKNEMLLYLHQSREHVNEQDVIICHSIKAGSEENIVEGSVHARIPNEQVTMS